MKSNIKGSALVTVMIISVLILMVIISVSSITNTIYRKQLNAVTETRDTYLAKSLMESLSDMICYPPVADETEVDGDGDDDEELGEDGVDAEKLADTRRLLRTLRGFDRTDMNSGISDEAEAYSTTLSFDFSDDEENWPAYVINATYAPDEETGGYLLTLVLRDETDKTAPMPNLLQLEIREFFSLIGEEAAGDTALALYKSLLKEDTALTHGTGVTNEEIEDILAELVGYFGDNMEVLAGTSAFIASRTQFVDEAFRPVKASPSVIYVTGNATVQPHSEDVLLDCTEEEVTSFSRYFVLNNGSKLIFEDTAHATFDFETASNVYFIMGTGASVEYNRNGPFPEDNMEFNDADIQRWQEKALTLGGGYQYLQALVSEQYAITPDSTLFSTMLTLKEQYESLNADIGADWASFLEGIDTTIAADMGAGTIRRLTNTTVSGSEGVLALDGLIAEIKDDLFASYINPGNEDLLSDSQKIKQALQWQNVQTNGGNWNSIIQDSRYYDVRLSSGNYKTPNFTGDIGSQPVAGIACIEIERGSILHLKRTYTDPGADALTIKLDRSLFIFGEEDSLECPDEVEFVSIDGGPYYVYIINTSDGDDESIKVTILGDHEENQLRPNEIYNALYDALSVDAEDVDKLALLESMMTYTKQGYVAPPPAEPLEEPINDEDDDGEAE